MNRIAPDGGGDVNYAPPGVHTKPHVARLCGVLIERRDSTVIIKDRHRIKQPKLLCLCGRSLYCLQRAAIRVSHSLYEALEKTGTEAGVTDFEALRILKSTSRAFSVAPACRFFLLPPNFT
jgi:hypothetical protein